MKAPPFAYAKPGSLAEAFALLEQHGSEAKVLAGGQSLIATLNMRLSTPSILIDITGIPGLAGIAVGSGKVRIGALTKHRDIERSEEIAHHAPLLSQAVRQIAHVAIRNSGTIGGSIALADPAAEWPACCLALDAEFVIASSAGARRTKARDFYRALYTTDLKANEILASIEFPDLGSGYRSVFMELARRHGDYAIAGVAAVARTEGTSLADVRLAYLGLGATAVLGRHAMAQAEGKAYSPEVQNAVREALGRDLDPIGDLYSSPATKLHLARVLTGRALAALAA